MRRSVQSICGFDGRSFNLNGAEIVLDESDDPMGNGFVVVVVVGV